MMAHGSTGEFQSGIAHLYTNIQEAGKQPETAKMAANMLRMFE